MHRSNETLVVIRFYQPGDEIGCNRVLYEGAMSTMKTAFFTALTREVTLQIIVITAAIMFVFMGLSPTICLLSVPVTVIVIFIAIYSIHLTKAFIVSNNVASIPRKFMSSESSGFWVAEAYEPITRSKDSPVCIVSENEALVSLQQNMFHNRTIIGTVAVSCNINDDKSAWMKWMSVTSKYQRKGIGTALLKEVIKFCQQKGYEDVDLVTTEFHDSARELFLKRNFELRQMYHKQLLGSVMQVLMYELSYRLVRRSHKLD